MRLMMYRRSGTEKRLAAYVDEDDRTGFTVIDIEETAARTGRDFEYKDLVSLIRGGPDALDTVRGILAAGEQTDSRVTVAHKDVLAPLDPPAGNVVAIGRNYSEHVGEMARVGKEADRPTVFSKAQNSINSPFGFITVDPKVSVEVDWEVELAVVTGSAALNVSEDAALDHVFGYTVLNDVSARDLQYEWGGQFFKGKSVDGYCPIGPCIVTADEIPDPQNLDLTLRVNGEQKQFGNTRDMIFSVRSLIAQLSLGMTLPAGTLIATGTPPGVGYARDPKEFLKPGDVMETEISGIGLMRNHVVASDQGVWQAPQHPGG